MTTVLCTLNDSSLPISQMEPAKKFLSNDLFIIERLTETRDRSIIFQEDRNQEEVEDIVDAVLLELGPPGSPRSILFNELKGDILEYVHSNGKISYDQLSSRIFQDLLCAFNFNTMAFKNDWQYSTVGHSHIDQYSDTRVFPRYTPNEIFQIGGDLRTIASWNISFGSSASLKSLADSMKNINADVYCLQNVNRETARSSGKDQLEELRSQLGRTWKMNFAKQADYQDGETGVGILYEEDDLVDSWAFVIEPLLEDNVGILQILKFQKFYIVNVNFSSFGNIDQKLDQIQFILDKLETFSKDRPMWLCGSFNFSPNSSVMRKLQEKFTIVSKTDNSTVSTEDNFVADYILLDNKHAKSRNIKQSAYTGTFTGTSSSHYPIYISVNDISEQWIGDFVVWQLSSGQYISSEIGIYIPPIKFQSYVNPDVGEVRFMGWRDIPTSTDEESPLHVSSYSGATLIADDCTSGWWCYCNGQTLTCGREDFMDACNFFTGNEHSQSFTVPCLSNFIVPNPRKDLSDPMKLVQFENGMASHYHEIIQPDESKTYSLKGKITIDADNFGTYGTEAASQLAYIHSGGTKESVDENSFMKQIKINLQQTTADLTANGGETVEAGDDNETKPNSNKLIALVYLGEF